MMASRGGAFVALIVVLFSLPAVVAPAKIACAVKEPLVPAMFVFGDSLVDVGNNNHLAGVNNSCKANYPPYGIDYTNHKPTGRFSNGYNLADLLAQQLGFAESPPPFLSLTSGRARGFARLIKSTGGINFASGASGILPTTGGPQVCGGGQVISLGDQVASFTRLVALSESKTRRKQRTAAAELISNSLVFISAGSNDLFEYTDSVEDPTNPLNANRNDTAFLHDLIGFYKNHVRDLYAAGATKFSVVSPSLVGCCPSQRKIANVTHDTDGSSTCLGTANRLSRQLYPMIESMLQDLRRDEMPDMNYSLVDSINVTESFFNDDPRMPASSKLITSNHSCCGGGDFGETPCNSSAPLCPDRRSFFFWDRFHPTQAVATFTAKLLFLDNGTYVHPVNVQQLVSSSPPP